MNIEDMLKNINPQKLDETIKKMQGMFPADQMAQAEKVLKSGVSANTDELKKGLNNPEFAKKLANNPEVLKKLNDMLNKH